MPFETLKKRNYFKIFIGVVAFIAVISTIVLNTSKAKYRTTQSIPLVRGTIKSKAANADLNIVAMYQKEQNGEYINIDEVPSSKYKFNTDNSYCEVNGVKDENITIERTKENLMNFYGIKTKGTKCYLYFDAAYGAAGEMILANITAINERTDFSQVVTETTTGIIYKAEDDDGYTYYFVGNSTDNWVEFAGFYWRIIRINGDGSIRMIYQGTEANTTGTGTQIGQSAFNKTLNNNMYVGYMYTSGQVHGLGTSSTVKGVLDTWYANNLANYASYIDQNAGFCGDRTPSTNYTTSNGSGGTGTTVTYYGAHIRLRNTPTPTFKCPDSNDLYTKNGSTKGNKALTYPIGLITIDEIFYAGGGFNNNKTYYLYTGEHYWTISPMAFHLDGVAAIYFIHQSGNPANQVYIPENSGVRPVINLKAETLFASNSKGTAESPYIVVE